MRGKFGRSGLWFGVTFALAAVAFAAGQQLPDGEGKSLLEGSCANCHELDRITEKHYGQQSWEDIVVEMREKGSPLSEDEVPVLVNYLATHFGEAPADAASADGAAPDAIRQLIAAKCTSCHGMDLIEGRQLDKDGWNTIVQRMVGIGAELTDAQASGVVDYLAKTYPPEKK